jgi:hypothetical protein
MFIQKSFEESWLEPYSNKWDKDQMNAPFKMTDRVFTTGL